MDPIDGNKSIACCSPCWSVRPRSAMPFCGTPAAVIRSAGARSSFLVGCAARSRSFSRESGDRDSRASAGPRTGPGDTRQLQFRHRPDCLPLPHCRKAGRRRDGCRLQGGRHRASPLRCPEIPARRPRARSASVRTPSPRGACRFCFEPSQYLHDSRNQASTTAIRSSSWSFWMA